MGLVLSAPAHADEKLRVTCQYFTPAPKTPALYKEEVQWQMANQVDWDKFQQSIDTSPLGKPSDQFIPNGKAEMFHISKRNADLLTGRDYYLTGGKVTAVTTSAIDMYLTTPRGFRDFLEKEMAMRPLPSVKKDAKDVPVDQKALISSPGIVVVYNGNSDIIQNPSWVVTKPADMAPYINFIKGAQRIQPNLEKFEAREPAYAAPDSYFIYLNVPHAPARFVTVIGNGNIRMTNTRVDSKVYNDSFNMFAFFKGQADRIMNPEKYKLLDDQERARDKTKSF